MHTVIRKLINCLLPFISDSGQSGSNPSNKAIDLHILSIHSQSTIDNLVSETSKSMKTILDYKLFAFVLEGNEGLHIWSDPLLSKSRILSIVKKDFPSADISTIQYINKAENNVINTFFHKPESVLSYDFSSAQKKARLYLIHESNPTPGKKDASHVLITSFENTLKTILKIKELEKSATTDPLTGCYNRRALNNILDHSISYAQRYKRDLSLIMMDIDYFKSINDTHGHVFGDEVLKHMSHTIKSSIRKSDFLARYGGEEFVVVLPETPLAAAVDIAHRFKKNIENLQFTTPANNSMTITASLGVSSVNPGDNTTSLISGADSMLYMAKAQGRNCVMSIFDTLPIQKIL